jgi:uncharacterized protein YcnI
VTTNDPGPVTTTACRAAPGRRRTTTAAVAALAGFVIALVPSALLSAHTEASAVAVAARSDATVTFEAEHGCGDSPTVGVRIQAPVPDARAGAVDGWTATATPDGAGNTVLEWTGGSVPADEEGAFPVELTVPDAVGSLLAFPAVQRCENGEELAWIGVTPGDEYPAPQVLVLAAGSEPAATLDDVPADAPGRDLLVALTEGVSADDAVAAPATTTPVTATPTTAAPATTLAPGPTTAPATTDAAMTTAPDTSAPASTVPETTAPAPTTTDGGDGGGSSAGVVIGLIIAVAVIGAIGGVVYARRRGVT